VAIDELILGHYETCIGPDELLVEVRVPRAPERAVYRKFRTRSAEEVREVFRRARADLWPALEAGKLRLPVDRVFPLAEAEAAQQRMRADEHFGKILLRC